MVLIQLIFDRKTLHLRFSREFVLESIKTILEINGCTFNKKFTNKEVGQPCLHQYTQL